MHQLTLRTSWLILFILTNHFYELIPVVGLFACFIIVIDVDVDVLAAGCTLLPGFRLGVDLKQVHVLAQSFRQQNELFFVYDKHSYLWSRIELRLSTTKSGTLHWELRSSTPCVQARYTENSGSLHWELRPSTLRTQVLYTENSGPYTENSGSLHWELRLSTPKARHSTLSSVNPL